MFMTTHAEGEVASLYRRSNFHLTLLPDKPEEMPRYVAPWQVLPPGFQKLPVYVEENLPRFGEGLPEVGGPILEPDSPTAAFTYIARAAHP